MKRRVRRKLSVKRETLQALNADHLQGVDGAASAPYICFPPPNTNPYTQCECFVSYFCSGNIFC